MRIHKIIFYIFSFLTFINAYALPSVRNIFKLPNIRKGNVNDSKIFKILKPATINNMMVPLVGMVDTFWVSKLGTSADLASVGSGDQVFSIYFSFMAFLPIILSPEISKLYATGNRQEISNLINISCILSLMLGSIGFILYFNTNLFARFFLSSQGEIYNKAISYLKIRSLSMPICLLNNVIFSVLRGMNTYESAIKINALTQLVNLLLNPIMMIKYNIEGVALSSVFAEVLCLFFYVKLLNEKKILKKNIVFFRKTSNRFMRLGMFIQLKYILINMIYITINKRLSLLDTSGVQLAAHIIICKLLSISEIIYRGFSSTATVLIPTESIYKNDRNIKKRIYIWSTIIGIIQCLIFFNLKHFLNHLTNDIDVLDLCKKLIVITTTYQYLDGINTVQEGILQGYQMFRTSSIISFVTSVPLLLVFSKINNVKEVWKIASIFVFIKSIILYCSVNYNDKYVKLKKRDIKDIEETMI